MSDIRKFLSIILVNKKVFGKALVGYSIRSLYDISNVIFLSLFTVKIEQGDLLGLKNILIAYILCFTFFHLVVFFTKNRTRTEVRPTYAKIIHKKYMEKFVKLDSTYTDKIGTGKIISIIEKGIFERSLAINQILWKFTGFFTTLLYVLYSFSVLGGIYVVSFLVVVTAMIFLAYYLNQKVMNSRKLRINASHEYSKKLVRIIMSKNEIMQTDSIPKEVRGLDDNMNTQRNASRGMNKSLHRFFFGPRLIVDVARVVLFGYAAFAIISSGGSVSSIVAIGGGLILLDLVLDNILSFYKDLTLQFDHVRKMRDFFEEGKTDYDINAGDEFTYTGGNIVFKDTSFGYNDTKVIDSLSLTIQGKQKTALVGPSGAGKSTIVKLIAGYIRPDSGTITVDGQDLTEVSLKSYYKHIGYLTQEPSVFDGTIRENLTYAITSTCHSGLDPESSESGLLEDSSITRASLNLNDRIQEAIRLSKCDFIYDFPDGLDTEIGERGIRLSGGQRQRLAIAKIFLKNPDIIILDEPTSALDSFSEEAITIAMNELFKDRTVIIIAHRLQTVKHADDIILLDKGEVIERGTHSDLVELGGQYAKMLELQSGF